MVPTRLLLGDEAIALGAVHAGISGVYAYPGTPSTEITEFIQANVSQLKIPVESLMLSLTVQLTRLRQKRFHSSVSKFLQLFQA